MRDMVCTFKAGKPQYAILRRQSAILSANVSLERRQTAILSANVSLKGAKLRYCAQA